MPTRKGWTKEALADLEVVVMDDGGFRFPNGDRYWDDGREPKLIAAEGKSRELWPDPADVPGDVLLVVEGRPDVVSAAVLGFPAVSMPSARSMRDDEALRITDGRHRVYAVGDCDPPSKPGRRMARQWADTLAKYGPTFLVELDAENVNGFDVGDVLMDGGPHVGRDFLQARMEGAEHVLARDPLDVRSKTLTAEQRARLERIVGNGRVAVVRTLADVPIRRVRWLWPKRVPLGKLTILAGLTGQGKSQLTCHLAAATSIGALDGDLYGEPADVLIVSAEDDVEDMITPRLIVAGADLSRVHVVGMRTLMHGRHVDSTIRLPTDTPAILEAVESRAVRLVILDPVAALLDRDHSAHSNQDVRDALELIRSTAEATRSAVVMVSHLLTKAPQGTDTLARLADSHAFSGLPRSVLFLTPHPDDEAGERGSRKLLIAAKGNLIGPGNHALQITIEDAVAGLDPDDREPVRTTRVVIGEEADLSTDDALMSSGERTEFQSAVRFLRDHLAESEAWAEDVKNAAKDDGHAATTVRKARERATYHRKGINNRSIWGLRDMPKPDSLAPSEYPQQERLA